METKRLKTEFIAGLTTFFTMAYIVVVNPSILATEGTGIPFEGALTSTVLLCFLMTLLMGLYAKLPYGVAPGMGVNAFFTFSIILGNQVPWQAALGIVFWSGVLFLLCSVTPVRVAIARSIPQSLRHATAAGIGLFITFIGLKNAGLVVSDPATLVRLGPLNHTSALVFIGMMIMVVFMKRKNPFAFLFGIVFVTTAALILGDIQAPTSWVSAPDFKSTVFQLDIWGALKWIYLPSIISIFFTDFFDSISTFIGCSYMGGMIGPDGEPKNLREGLIVDSLATLGAGLLGTSSGTAYVESSAGIEAGGRTGLTAVVIAFCFLPFLFLSPLAGMIPAYATAPVLILVGSLMFKSISGLRFDSVEEYVPAFLTIALIPLTFSITQGLLWGFVTHVLLFVIAGRKKEISPVLWGVAATSLALLVLEHGAK
jgi:adenine/guanine/hypoxanthine permease